ncbi:MAG TPA: hypothetical protein VGY76_13080 [Solirubrobacteraceae bacterium]|jgi:hypothetical protein|nr:hypothetical protein [Solirubrobacteraceae bacterium]
MPTSSGAVDPLVENGLGSPMCEASSGAGSLSAQVLANCRTSGWVAAGAPTANYAFDMNMGGGGLLGLDPQGLFQQYLLAPIWMGLVWIMHALLVMLEWAYTLDLIDAPAADSLGRGLRETQAVFTQPWLVLALAVASVLAAYHGLVRRQVARTVGQALLMAMMMIGGLWVIADPTGTVGEVGRLANQASLGALGAFAQGSPAAGARTLSDGMRGVFAAGIGDPWCYLEFGDVQWCRDPLRLEPRLRADALRLAAGEQALIGCRLNSGPFSICVAPGSTQARAYARSAELLRDARSNGELFLALAANGNVRNSTAVPSGLLTVLCAGPEIGKCHGTTAPQAEFRGAAQTGQRAAGLLLIVVGGAGMVALLGFLALHLLAAALLSLFYLLLAPAAVLAPALGDGGRAAFRNWATRLLGAMVAKLMYSLFLGAMLAMMRILLALRGMGWWPQWLLVGTAWWGAFHHRYHLLGALEGRHFQRRVVLPAEENLRGPSR